MAARKWTAEQRKQQSLKIRQWQPWLNSTGPKTLEGKAKASHNSFKGGVMQQVKLMGKQLNRLIREQKQLIDGWNLKK